MPISIPSEKLRFAGTPEIQIQREAPLRADRVQGEILAGFNKDNQNGIFLGMVDPKKFKK